MLIILFIWIEITARFRLYESAIMQRYNKLLVNASWELVGKSMIMERVSIKSMKDAHAISVKELSNSFLYFGVDARARKRIDYSEVKGIKLEQYAAAFTNYKTCSQARKLMEIECLANEITARFPHE